MDVSGSLRATLRFETRNGKVTALIRTNWMETSKAKRWNNRSTATLCVVSGVPWLLRHLP